MEAMGKILFLCGFFLLVLLICPTLAAYDDRAVQYNSEGVDFAKLGQYPEALASFDKAIAIDPSYTDVYFNRGLALDNLGRYSEAVVAYDKALALNPDNAEVVWNNRGVVQEELGLYAEAFTSYDKATTINPEYVLAWYNRGLALDRLSRYSESVDSFDKALALEPNNTEVWYNRGNSLTSLRRYSDAVASYNKAISLTRNTSMHGAIEELLYTILVSIQKRWTRMTRQSLSIQPSPLCGTIAGSRSVTSAGIQNRLIHLIKR